MALQTDPRYLVLDQARKANDKDEELQNMIGEFNLARMDLNNEIGKSERNDARIAELNEKVNDLYGKIMADEGMVAYNEAKRDCENLVNYIDAIINTAINGGDPLHGQLLHLRRLPLRRNDKTRNAAVLCRPRFACKRRFLPTNRARLQQAMQKTGRTVNGHGGAFAHDAAIP